MQRQSCIMSYFLHRWNSCSKFTPKVRKLQLICFRDKMPKNLVCVPITSIHISFSSKYLHQLHSIWVQKYPNEIDLQIFYTLFVFVLYVQVSGLKLPPMKWAVIIKLYPMSKTRILLSKILPQTSKKITQIYLPYLWHYATLILPNQASSNSNLWKLIWGSCLV